MRCLRWLLLTLLLWPSAAWAQTACPTVNKSPSFTTGGNVFGYIGSQWQAFFGSKADANNGTLCNVTISGLTTFGLSNLQVQGALTAYGPLTVGNVIITTNGITIGGVTVGAGGVAAGTPDIVVGTLSSSAAQTISTTNPINTQSGATYTLLATDGTQEVDLSYSSGPTTVTLPTPGSTGFDSGFATTVCALSQPSTLSPASGLVNGLAAANLIAGQCADVRTNGSAWQAIGSAPISESLTSTALSSCGTGPTITGTDISGYIVPGSGSPTACTLTFHAGFYPAMPRCVITGVGTGSSVPSIATQSASAITVDLSAAFSGTDGFNYVCSES